MYYDIFLPDGRLAGPPDLSVRNPHLAYDAPRRRALALAQKYCDWGEGKSVVFAKDTRVLATVYGQESWTRLIDFAVDQLTHVYRMRRWRHPTEGVVALLRPFPEVRLDGIERAGVDTIYTPERIKSDPKGREEMWISHWLGTLATQHGDWPRIFVLPHNKPHLLY